MLYEIRTANILKPVPPRLPMRPRKTASTAKEIEEQFCTLIASGQLKPNDPLPLYSAIARQFRVNESLVRSVCCRLQHRGLIVGRTQTGVYVAANADWRLRQEQEKPPARLDGNGRPGLDPIPATGNGLDAPAKRESSVHICVNRNSSIPPQVQIFNQVRFAIASGRLRPGDKLVAAAPLGEKLDICRSNVHSAYNDLKVLGLVRIRPKRDVTVIPPAPRLAVKPCRTYIAEELFRTIQEGRNSGMSSQELMAIVQESLAVNTLPYMPVPREVMNLAEGSVTKKRTRSRKPLPATHGAAP